MDYTDSDIDDVWLQLRNINLEDENKRAEQTLKDAEVSLLTRIASLEQDVKVLTSALEKSRATNGVLEGQLQYAYSRAQSHHQPMLTSADSPAVLEHRNVPALSSTVPPVVINHACNCQEHKPWCLPHTEWFWVFQALDRHLSPNDLGN